MLKLFSSIFCVFLCVSCNHKDNKLLSIKFSADRSTILISNIESAALLQLKNNINKDTMYQKLVSVLETLADNDSVSMEREWPGKLSMIADTVVFIPDLPFLKGKNYLIETLLGMKFAAVGDVIHSDVGHLSKKQQKVLSR